MILLWLLDLTIPIHVLYKWELTVPFGEHLLVLQSFQVTTDYVQVLFNSTVISDSELLPVCYVSVLDFVWHALKHT